MTGLLIEKNQGQLTNRKKPDKVGHKHIVHLVLKMSLIGWIPPLKPNPLLILAWPHAFKEIDYDQAPPFC